MCAVAAEIQSCLERAVSGHIFPCGVLMRLKRGGAPEYCCAGRSQYGGGFAADATSLFDLASMTKVVATTPLAMLLYEAGSLDLDRPVSRWLPDFEDGDHPEWRARITPRMLLAHCGGFAPFFPFHQSYAAVCNGDEKRRIVRHAALQSPPCAEAVYSDIGMMVMGQVVERILGKTLDLAAKELLFTPLGMDETGYNPHEGRRCIPTEEKKESAGEYWRGIVHDENARWLNGVSGHAGLFSSGRDLSLFARMLLEGGMPLFRSRETLALFAAPANLVQGSERCLGWTQWSKLPGAYGHTGFTGVSLWVDANRGSATLLLTNAVHPHRECKQNGYFHWRDRLHLMADD